MLQRVRRLCVTGRPQPDGLGGRLEHGRIMLNGSRVAQQRTDLNDNPVTNDNRGAFGNVWQCSRAN